MPNRRRAVNIGLWNVRTLANEATRSELVTLMDEHEIDICALTETKSKDSVIKTFAPGLVLWNSSMTGTIGGVGFLLRSKVLASNRFTPINNRLASIVLKFKNTPDNSLGVIVVYSHTEGEGNVAARNSLHDSVESVYKSLSDNCGSVIIMEDWNCRFGTRPIVNGVPTDPKASPNAIAVQQLADRLGLVVLSLRYRAGSVGSWHHPKTGESHAKDLVVGERRLHSFVENMRTIKVENSDHALINFTLDLSALKAKPIRASKPAKQGPRARDQRDLSVAPPSRPQRRPNYGECRAERALVQERLMLYTESRANVAEGRLTWKNLRGYLIECQRAACLPHPPSKFLTGEERNRRIRDLGLEVSKYANDRDSENYHSSRKLLDSLLVPKGKSKPKGVSNESLRQHYDCLFNRSSELQKLDRIRRFSDPLEALSVLPTLAEVEGAVASIRSNTAPGESGVYGNLLKIGGEQMNKLLLKFFCSLWPTRLGGDGARIPEDFMGARITSIWKGKGSEMDPAMYRSIFLLEVPGKVLFKLLGRRIEPLSERFLWDSQCGFRTDRSTDHAVLSLKLLQQMAYDVGGPLCAVLLDVQKAFDSLPRGLIMQALEVIGVPSVLVDFYSQVHSNVRCVLDPQNTFIMTRGVRQGSSEGPVLFNLAYQLILNQAFRKVPGLGLDLRQTSKIDTLEVGDGPSLPRVSHLLYADDLVVVDSETGTISAAVKSIQAIGSRLGVEIAPSKSELIWLSGRPANPGTVTMSGIEIPEKTSVEYLGVLFENSKPESEKHDVTHRVGKALGALAEIRPYLRVPTLSVRARTDRVNSEVLSSLYYGAETWSLTKSKLMVTYS